MNILLKQCMNLVNIGYCINDYNHLTSFWNLVFIIRNWPHKLYIMNNTIFFCLQNDHTVNVIFAISDESKVSGPDIQ